MAVSGLLVAAPLALLLVGLVVLGLLLLAQAAPASAQAPTVVRRHAVIGAGAATVVGGLAVVLVPLALSWALPHPYGVPGLALAAAPALAAALHVAVLALTELTWPRRRGGVRVAGLTSRPAAAVTGTRLGRALGAALTVLVVTVAGGAALAGPDGRSVSGTDPTGRVIATSGPFPGAPYGVAALAGVAVLLLGCLLTLRLVAGRPPVQGSVAGTDDALRRAGAHRVVRGTLAGTLATIGPLLGLGGLAAAESWSGTPALLASVTAGLGLLALVAALAVLAVPAPSVPWPAPQPAGVG